MTTQQPQSNRIGIWGIQSSGKTSYFNALDVALHNHQFVVFPVGDSDKVRTYNEGVARFRRQLFALPTAAQHLGMGFRGSIDTSEITVSNSRIEASPEPPLIEDDNPSLYDSLSSNLFLRDLQKPNTSDAIDHDENNQIFEDTVEVAPPPSVETRYGEIDEDNILKLQVTFPNLRDQIMDLKFVGENANDWVNKTLEVWLPDHGGETWTGEAHRDLMQSMIKFYSQPEFTGFMFFFDPTFQGEGGESILGIDVPYYESFRNFLTGLQQARREARLDAHCAVILTKTDQPRFREYAIPADNVSNYYPNLLAQMVLGKDGFNQLRSAFESDRPGENTHLKTFCTSSAGLAEIGSNFTFETPSGEAGMKTSPQPLGVEESFLWLVNQITSPRQRKNGIIPGRRS
jgi:hypothetical protein